MRMAASLVLGIGLCCAAETGVADTTLFAPSEPLISFDGFYAGGNLGPARRNDGDDRAQIADGFTAARFEPAKTRALSAYAGYEVLRGGYVYGAEAHYTNGVDLSVGDTTGQTAREVTRVFDLRGRLGYRSGQYLIYGALGWSEANMRARTDPLAPGARSADLNGLNMGVGFEYDINDSVSATADFTYRDLDGGFGGAGNGTDLDLNTFGLSLAYRF